MEMKKFELEVIKGIEKVDSNALEHIKGGISNAEDEEKCCDIQFSCNNKGDKGKSIEKEEFGPQTISII